RGLKQERLDDIDESIHLIAHRGGDGFHTDGAAVVDLDDRSEELASLLVEASIIDAFQIQRQLRDRQRKRSLRFYRCVISDAAEQAIGDARRATASPRQFPQRRVFGLKLEQLRVGLEDLVQRLGRVELDVAL